MLSRENYSLDGFYDELIQDDHLPRAHGRRLVERLQEFQPEELIKKQQACERAMFKMGVTFDFHDSQQSIIPFDIVPRTIPSTEWNDIEGGLIQRIKALNLFIEDIYHDQNIIKDGLVPSDVIMEGDSYLKCCKGIRPSQGIYTNISGIDLIRDGKGDVYVLEDNLRCPSGVSYVLKNRHLMKRTLPKVFRHMLVRPVEDYPLRLLQALQFLCPHSENPMVVLLTPGRYNSAFYEHAFLAQQMGIPLVEGSDLVVKNDFVYMKTTKGLAKVDVIYRRISDEYLDPEVFNPKSMLGVPGIFRAYSKGHVALANAPGAGVADDKVIYTFVPDMIRYYLKEEPILKNVPTYMPRKADDMAYIMEHLGELVVKEALGAGGYGMLVGPMASKAEIETFREKIKAHPRAYIAQPTLSLSRVPTLIGDHLEGRHVDLRPYALYGNGIYVMPGGLTRVALKKGSLVVNSSQGGGTKDTWVVAEY
jgi:uncharacterized circularly permuted ATP-grasp superfamily protein